MEVVDENKLGRVRRVADVSGDALQPFVQEAVEPGSSVLTDAWGGYAGLSGIGYDHMVINQSASPNPAHILMPAVHRIARPFRPNIRQLTRSSWPPGEDPADGSYHYMSCQVAQSKYPAKHYTSVA